MPKQILIIGGGFTGLTAAYELAKRSAAQITLIEKGPALGGLAGDFALCGTQIEKTYHHIFRTDADILRLVSELGLDRELMWCDSSLGIFYDGKTYPFMSPLDVLRFSPCDLAGRIRLGAVAFYLQKKKRWQELAPQTAYNWMRKACGQRATDVIWGPLLKGKFDRYWDSVSMAWLWARIHVRANSRASAGCEQLGYFRGGFAKVTCKLEQELVERGAHIRKGCSVESLDSVGGRAVVSLDGRTQEFDNCLFTGSSSAFARILPGGRAELAAYRSKLESIVYLGAICLVFVSEQDIGEFYWLNINQAGAPFLVFVHHTQMVDKSFYGSKHVYYIGTYKPCDSPAFSLSEDELSRQWFTFLQKIYPRFDPAQVLEKHLFRLRDAQHVVDCDYAAKIPDYRTPLAGVYLANFSQIFPEDRGTNYAVREGAKVAHLMLSDLQSGPRA